MLTNTADSYGVVTKSLHWLILILVTCQIYLAVAAFRANDPLREAELLSLHRPLGITILVLMLLRLGWKLANPRPALPRNMGGLSRALAGVTHWLLYGLLIAIPVVGWAKAGAENIAVSYFGLFVVPGLMAPEESLVQALRTTHLYLNTALLGLLPIHVLAALWHHFWRRDNTLRRMLPGVRLKPIEE